MNKKIFAALASATMALSATGSLAVFAEDFDVVTEADGTNGTVSGVTIPSSGVVVNEENFPDSNFRDAIKVDLGAGYGDKLSKTQLEAVKYIHVPANVKNLTGVKYFTNLIGIDNYSNGTDYFTDVATDYTDLDSTAFNDSKLVTADLSSNTKLTTINFENVSDLNTLVVPEGNTLKSITVIGGTTGKYAQAPITELDLSKNKLLSDVTVNHTDVAKLDLSNNPYLTVVNVSNNKINTLDLTNNMALTKVMASYNHLYSLDVPNTYHLNTIQVAGNVLQEFDLTGLTGLVSLDITDNELRSLDLSPVTETLRSLGVANNHLGSIITKDLKPGDDLYLNLNPQVVYVDSSYDGVNLTESFSDLDSRNVTLVTDNDASYNNKTGVLDMAGNNTVEYTYNTELDGSPNLMVFVKKESVMNRLYNPNSGEHFYTSDVKEKDALVKLGWEDEGIGWTAPGTSTGNAPVYRLYNPNAGDHHYTKSSSERDILVSVGWKYEGIGWYSYETDQMVDADSTNTTIQNTAIKAVNVLREYNPNAKAAGAHNYTVNYAENDFLVSVGWLDEGIAWKAMK